MNPFSQKIQEIFKKKVSPFFILTIFGLLVYLPIWIGSVYVSASQIGGGVDRIPVLGSDSLEYLTLADNISRLRCFTMTDSSAHETFRTPGYPFFVSAVRGVFDSIFAVTFVQCLLALLVGYFIYKILEPYAGRRLSSYAIVLFILEPSVILHSVTLLSDIPYVFLVTWAFFLLVRSKPDMPHMCYIGLILGISVLFRPISLFLIPVFICIYWLMYFSNIRQLLKVALVLSISFFVVILPWFYRNYKVTGAVGISSISTYNITYFNIPLFISYKEGITVKQAQDRVIASSGIPLKQGLKLENSKVLSKISGEYLKENFFGYLFFHVVKTAPFFFGSSIKNTLYSYNLLYNNDTNYEYEQGSVSDLFIAGNIKDFVRRIFSEGIFLIERVLWGVLLILGFFGLFNKNTRKFTLVSLVMVAYFAFLTGPVSYARYRLPAEPYMFILLSVCLASIRGWLKRT